MREAKVAPSPAPWGRTSTFGLLLTPPLCLDFPSQSLSCLSPPDHPGRSHILAPACCLGRSFLTYLDEKSSRLPNYLGSPEGVWHPLGGRGSGPRRLREAGRSKGQGDRLNW